MELDDLESQGTFIDFSWHSFEEEGSLSLENAFALFSNGPRHALTGAILWQAAAPSAEGYDRDEAID